MLNEYFVRWPSYYRGMTMFVPSLAIKSLILSKDIPHATYAYSSTFYVQSPCRMRCRWGVERSSLPSCGYEERWNRWLRKGSSEDALCLTEYGRAFAGLSAARSQRCASMIAGISDGATILGAKISQPFTGIAEDLPELISTPFT